MGRSRASARTVFLGNVFLPTGFVRTVFVGTAIIAGACSGGTSSENADTVLRTTDDLSIDADSLDAALAEGAGADDADDAGTEDGDGAGAGASESADDAATTSTSTTLPQEEQTLEEEFFDAVQVFMSCLEAEGFTFIGTPNAELGADAPANAQPYIDALIACAARSGVQEKLAEVDAARADMTPEEVEEENRAFLIFRDCMVGRGWVIPDPTPDETGLLFHGIASTQEWIAPNGQDLATSDDTSECQELVQEDQEE